MNELLILDQQSIEETFFENCKLFGISTNLLPHKLCWLLNRKLNLNFQRKIEDDIAYHRIGNMVTVKPLKHSLFDDLNDKEPETYFSIYEHKYDLSEISIKMYTNHVNNKFLVPELRNINFFMLVRDDNYQYYIDEIIVLMKQITEIQDIKALHINEYSSFVNLIT